MEHLGWLLFRGRQAALRQRYHFFSLTSDSLGLGSRSANPFVSEQLCHHVPTQGRSLRRSPI
jgi:hypothetical protein